MLKIVSRFANLGKPFVVPVMPSVSSYAKLVHCNHDLSSELGLSDLSTEELIDLLAGNLCKEDYQPTASCYMGHQFGVAVPKLGDGRAMLIAEHQDPTNHIWELQLKGAGKTPFSRMGDGRAVLRSTIREYLASYAMQQLSCPTTQALAFIHTNNQAIREKVESCAVILRVAPSFIRFGHLEYYAHHGLVNELKQLVNFVAANYFTDLKSGDIDFIPQFLRRVITLNAEMVARWQSLGFVHGVMNTDNMSILGLTIDYGPFAFMECYNPTQIFNHSDSEGRYTYTNQPYMVWWNLYRLAEALSAIYPHQDELEQVLSEFATIYNQNYMTLMAGKLGLKQLSGKADSDFLDKLLLIMQQEQIDWTFFWRQLSLLNQDISQISSIFPSLALENWLRNLQQRYDLQDLLPTLRQKLMLATNPAICLRTNFLQQAIIQAEHGDYSEVARLFSAFENPFVEQDQFADLYVKSLVKHANISLSCSS